MPAQVESITYVTRAEELVWGIALLALSMIIHGLGMVMTLSLTTGFKRRLGASRSLIPGIATVVLGSWLIMVVQIVEILMWTTFLQWKDCFVNFSTAAYYTALQYTTVGSALNLPRHWRLLEAMIASAGLMGFAWSTGVLLTLADEFQHHQLHSLRALRKVGRKPASTMEPPDTRADGP